MDNITAFTHSFAEFEEFLGRRNFSRAYKRREGMQQQKSRVQTWADECALNVHEMLKIEISIFSTHANSYVHPPTFELC